MKKNFRKAYDELKKMGAPVIEGGWSGEDTFRISGEDNYPIVWAEYYYEGDLTLSMDSSGVNHDINETLQANGLFAEWVNAGVLGVYTS